jgi:hypothetical protein
MDHEPSADLTADQVLGLLELRGMRALDDDDLAAVTALAAGLRQQALTLLRAVRASDVAGETA